MMSMDLLDWGIMLAKIVGVFLVLMHVAPIMAWVERRGSALMQNRLGPNRVGPFGLLQSAADGIKFIFKEDPIPGHVQKFYYVLAPILALAPAVMTFAVIPFGSSLDLGDRTIHFQITNLNVGLLYIFSIASLGVYGIIMGGWASNNKYALLGSLRSSSQMISYELSLGLSVIPILMIHSTLDLQQIVANQGELLYQLGPFSIPKWGVFLFPIGPLAFLLFMTSVFAETNRLPFDLPEGESEIVAGYHLEYGSMKFAILMMAEYINMFVGSAVMVSLFFGGYHGFHFLLPYLPVEGMAREWIRILLEIGAFGLKVGFFMWFFVWVRWTLPRFRYDQLMDLGWKVMLPLAMVNILLTGAAIYLGWV